MNLSKILGLCENASRFARVRGACGALGNGILRGVTRCEDALEILADDAISLVIVDRPETKPIDFIAVSSLVQIASLRSRQCSVVVLTDDYLEDEATTLFQLGVTDYLEYAAHQSRLTPIVAKLAGLECPSHMELEIAALAYPIPKSRRLKANV